MERVLRAMSLFIDAAEPAMQQDTQKTFFQISQQSQTAVLKSNQFRPRTPSTHSAGRTGQVSYIQAIMQVSPGKYRPESAQTVRPQSSNVYGNKTYGITKRPESSRQQTVLQLLSQGHKLAQPKSAK